QSSYQVRAFTVGDSGCPSLVGEAEFSTGDLPPQFKRLNLSASGSPSIPLTLMDVQVEENDLHWLVAFNADGQLVWYYPIPRYLTQAAAGRAVHGLVRLTNGDFLYITKRIGIEEITPDGRIVRRIGLESTQVHHDLLELPDGRIMFLGAEDRSIDDTPNGGARDRK